MSVCSTPAPDNSPATTGDTPFYREVLHELIEMGLDLARQAHAAAKGDIPAAAQAFDQMARTVRRTIGLAQRLNDPVPRETPVAQRRAMARRRILRDVEDAIQRKGLGDRESRGLRDELLERLDGPDVADDIDHRPINEIIADICRDLGLVAPPGVEPWVRRRPADIATLWARAAAGVREADGATRRAWEGAG
jgi:hypothetical protein